MGFFAWLKKIFGKKQAVPEQEVNLEDVTAKDVSSTMVQGEKEVVVKEEPLAPPMSESFVKKSQKELEADVSNKLIIEQLKLVYDPEVAVDIWNLELVYDIKVEGSSVEVVMTFTSPLCPYGPELVEQVTESIKSIGFDNVHVEVVIDPPWVPSEHVKELLGVA